MGRGEPLAADLTTRDGTSKLGCFLVEDFKQYLAAWRRPMRSPDRLHS
jgi:hypothetical protein